MGGARRAARKERPASEGGGVARSCARAARRRAARQDEAVGSRRQPDAQELEALRKWLREGQQARFSSRRLLQFDLDESGLLQEALAQGQDAIAFALLQAGVLVLSPEVSAASADAFDYVLEAPSSFSSPSSTNLEVQEDVRQSITMALRLFPPSAQVWLAATLEKMRASFLQSGDQSRSSSNDNAACAACSRGTGDAQDESNDEAIVLEWLACRHTICARCALRAIEAAARASTSSLRCPFCGAEQEDDCSPVPLERLGTPEQVRLESKAKFDALPARFVKALHGTPKPKLVRQSPMAAKYLMPGDTQDRRQEKFLNAVIDGDLWRVRALIDLGVDVNLRDQHGASALVWATMLPNAERIAALLVEAGADPTLGCNMGVDRLQILEQPRAPWTALEARPKVSELIPWSSTHPGAGSFVLDNACSRSCARFLLESSRVICPIAPCADAQPAAERRYLLDTHGWIRDMLAEALLEVTSARLVRVFSAMRTLTYAPGISLAPHIDLHRTDRDGIRSTHTFILYLDGSHAEGDAGGATALLHSLKSPEETLAVVAPHPCRLLVFPHKCPHEGRLVTGSKVILRGEIAMEGSQSH